MSAHFTTPTDEMLLLAETLGEVKTKADKLEAEFATQARPLEAATNALSAALSGIKALQFHVLDNNLGALSARVEEMRKAVDEQVGVIALELKKADETNAAKAGQEAEALRSEIAALQAQLGTLGAQFSAQLERVEFSAKEEAKKLQLIPGPAGAAGASLNPRGTFIDGETYNRLDVVTWLGSSYIAAVDGVTEKPSKNSNQWQVLASRGGGAAGGAADFGSLAGVAQINQGGTGQTTRAAGLNALLPSQTGNVQYMLLTDGAGTVSWGAQPVAGLPSQTGNSGKLLTTNGTSASWSNAVTVSGNNATVTGTLTVNGVATAGSYLTSAAGLTFPGALSANGYYLYSGSANGLTMYGYGSTYDVYIGNRAGTRAISIAANSTVVSIPDTTASTTTSSGALVVGNGTSGGLGVGGSVNIHNNLTLGYASAGDSVLKIIRSVGGNEWLQIAGWSAGSLGNNAYSIDAVNGAGARPVYFRRSTDAGSTYTNFLTWDTSNNATFAGAINAGGNVTISGSNGYAVIGGRQWSFRANSSGGSPASGCVIRDDSAAADRLTIDINGNTSVLSTTASTSTSSGALVVSGGVGVAGAVYAGGALFTVAGAGFNTPDWRFYQSGTSGYIRDLVNGQMALQFVSGNASTIQVYATGTQDSTTTTSGALVSSGGLGVAGAVNAGTFYGLVDGVTAPATAGGYARIYVDSADGDLKVKFGDGTVKTIATDS